MCKRLGVVPSAVSQGNRLPATHVLPVAVTRRVRLALCLARLNPHVARRCRTRCAFSNRSLECNRIGNPGVSALADALVRNATLTELSYVSGLFEP